MQICLTNVCFGYTGRQGSPPRLQTPWPYRGVCPFSGKTRFGPHLHGSLRRRVRVVGSGTDLPFPRLIHHPYRRSLVPLTGKPLAGLPRLDDGAGSSLTRTSTTTSGGYELLCSLRYRRHRSRPVPSICYQERLTLSDNCLSRGHIYLRYDRRIRGLYGGVLRWGGLHLDSPRRADDYRCSGSDRSASSGSSGCGVRRSSP